MKDYRKRILSAVIVAALSICTMPQIAPVQVCPVLSASAVGTTENGLTYAETDDGTGIKIKGYSGSSADIVIPDVIDSKPVTEIDSSAFASYNVDIHLTSVVLPSGLKKIGSNAFSGQTELTAVTLPESLTTLETGAFSSCGLTAITIPSSVKELGSQVFASCTQLSDIVIPQTLTKIGGAAFRDTVWLTNKKNENPLVVVNGILIDGTACEGDAEVPDGVTSIADSAFSQSISYFSKLTSVSLPDSVTSIGENAFYNCGKLENITLSKNLSEIGYSAFGNCTSLKEVVIPDSVTSIGGSAFFSCGSLSSVVLPSGLETIANSTFISCSQLKYISIPESVKTIDMRAFLGCSSLNELIIPASVESIGFQTFTMCSNLKILGYTGSYAESFAQNNGLTFEALEQTGSSISNASLTLEDDLGLNFYIDGITNDSEAASYTVLFSGECEEAGEPVNITKRNGRYCATANIQADNMNEIITAKLIKNEKTADICYCSVNRYLDSVDTSGSAELAALVAATKKYGAVSEAYFNDPENMPEAADHSAEYFTDTFKPVKNSNDMISLVLYSRLAVRLYIDGLKNGEAAAYGNDETLNAERDANGRCYFEVTGIDPKKLAADIVIRYKGSSYTFKPLSWAYLVKKNNVTGKNKVMADTLYEYYTSAAEYAATIK